MKKLSNITESAWGDMRHRGSGKTVRREDELTNLKDLVPVDMGGSVLWADKDLELTDETCHFAYDEVQELIKNSEWRLPIREEVSELFHDSQIMKNTDEVCILEGDFDGSPQLILYKKGYKLADSDELYQETAYCCWTSTKCQVSEAYYMISIKQYSLPASVPLHYKNRSCVRLVKDKK